MQQELLESERSAGLHDLVTTGEAAKLLSTSLQHVVDLCDRGDLPFSTVGRHRRARRTDLEVLAARTQRLTRDQLRSLWLSQGIAGKLVADPNRVLHRARRNLAHMRSIHTRGQGARWLAEWEQILNGPPETVLDALTSPAPRARELRQNSPFAGVLTDKERLQILESFQRARVPGSSVKRAELAHILRAASQIVGEQDVVVIGSQSVLGSFAENELPDPAVASIEAYIAFFDDPDNVKSDEVDGAIGEDSLFHAAFGYYGQGVAARDASFGPRTRSHA